MCKTKVKNVNSIDVSDHIGLNQNYDYECSDDFQYQDNIEELFVLGNQDATVTVNIAGKNVSILVDSGASVNAIDHTLFDQLKSSNTILEKSNAKIYPYGKTTSLDLVGKATFPVKVGSKSLNVEFHIIKGSGKPLIGHKTATELGILRIGLPDDNIASVSSETESILRSFQDRFEGLGKLKDFQLKLYVDENVEPVAQPARKIPFKMREKVESKLKELEDLDVIEKVEGPTPWVSALVPMPKSNNDIRLCVEMRCANKAIQRERFPLLNIDETLEQMNGASVFSKLDLAQAFHQVELESHSRYITTFATNNGLYRYKRLFHGVNSAPEIYQRIIQQVIQDIPGCKNIIDDIIIYASNQQEHDKILRMLLTRLREKGLTLNRNKCEFNKSELKFMAHTLSSSGIKIADDKVKAVKETPPPTNPSEVKSFLGLINFCSKFIKIWLQ